MWKVNIIDSGIRQISIEPLFFCDCVYLTTMFDLLLGLVFLLKSNISAGYSLVKQACLLIKGQTVWCLPPCRQAVGWCEAP